MKREAHGEVRLVGGAAVRKWKREIVDDDEFARKGWWKKRKTAADTGVGAAAPVDAEELEPAVEAAGVEVAAEEAPVAAPDEEEMEMAAADDPVAAPDADVEMVDAEVVVPEENAAPAVGGEPESATPAEFIDLTPAEQEKRKEEKNDDTGIFWLPCGCHQVQLGYRKEQVQGSGDDITTDTSRICNVMRARGNSRKLREYVPNLKIPEEEKEELAKVMKRAIQKPQKGRWCSFHQPGKRLLAMKKYISPLIRGALGPTLREAEERKDLQVVHGFRGFRSLALWGASKILKRVHLATSQ